tara:strand:- start:355 stop:567 length:213 start_codon:yes stop_codon:yes gene_type:complete
MRFKIPAELDLKLESELKLTLEPCFTKTEEFTATVIIRWIRSGFAGAEFISRTPRFESSMNDVCTFLEIE